MHAATLLIILMVLLRQRSLDGIVLTPVPISKQAGEDSTQSTIDSNSGQHCFAFDECMMAGGNALEQRLDVGPMALYCLENCHSIIGSIATRWHILLSLIDVDDWT